MIGLLVTRIPDNSAYGVFPTWAIIIACIWAVLMVAIHVAAFTSIGRPRGQSH